MSIMIDEENQKILDAILPQFEFNEVINVKNCVRKLMEGNYRALKNTPIDGLSDAIRDFLLKSSFAVNYCGEALINSKGITLKNAGSLHGFQNTLKKQYDYIVIDDDNFNNHICLNFIRIVHPDAPAKAFTDPNVGLRHIQANYATADANDAILLLDINMPTLLGWDVLDEFKNFSAIIRNHFKIFMLTSSVSPKDKERALGNPFLWGYIEKPLSTDKLKSLLTNDNPFSLRSKGAAH